MGKHIHIALVGGQPAPVFYGVYQCNPDTVILICSKQTKSEAERVKKLLELNQFSVEIKLIDSINLSIIHSQAETIKASMEQDDELTINLVGGTKAWALIFYTVFETREKTSFHLVDQNNRMWSILDRSSEPLYQKVDIDELLELYGNPIVKYTSFSEYNEEDIAVMDKIQDIRKNDRKAFKYLAANLSDEYAQEYAEQRSGVFRDGINKVEWRKPNKVVVKFENSDEILSSRHATSLFFNSGWFEFKVATILSQWNKANEIRLNCIFPLIPGQNKDNRKNEVDIIVSTDTKLLFVECKTSIKNGTDIDKFSTVVKNYGGTGTKALFISEQRIPPLVLKKCEESKILSFSLKDNRVEKLYEILDSELNTTNA